MLRTVVSLELIALGMREIRAHKLRSLLTTLGMIFGVGAVICMLSIGEGASAAELENIRLLGSENIILRSVEPPQATRGREQNRRVNSYGITHDDVARLRELPHVRRVVRMREVADKLLYGARKAAGTVVGASVEFFQAVHVEVERGRPLVEADDRLEAKVCVIGAEAARELFAHEDPLGRHVTVVSPASGSIPYEVVGLLRNVQTAGAPAKGVAARNVNRDVYIPWSTADARYGELKVSFGSGSREMKRVQVSDVYLNADDQSHVLALSKLAGATLAHTHKEADFVVTVPLELIQQAEKTKRNWQIVLGSIAGISLLVGGIGIMNIMLASVTERTREIGIRRALGAKRRHITAQFLVETTILSVSGGVMGIAAGVGFAAVVTRLYEFQTIIPWWGVVLSFCVSVIIGIVFGLYPARAAAALDPIEALRYE